ncbi:VWA domain-containing protein [Candidatus Thioglobus sp.]|uniref:vWA domain-containing protein n=1 Tax=Candidatus Thioglobus sp. TaxID=2026721 RepID=UPI0026122C7F|nr:VWA domain-containing protein [Candidatus Thioglobus sp.]MDG2395767.1 VWA domain-containing protein [Candidatus Thioglobus sp.]
MVFEQIELLYLIIPVALLWFFIHSKNSHIEDLFSTAVLAKISLNNHKISTKTRLRLLLLSMALMIVALSKPALESGEIKLNKQLSDVIVAIDMSKSMLANDIYPNRFEFAKNKLQISLDEIKNTRIGILGFANQAFLISPLTDDFNSLKFLIKNLRLDSISLTGTNISNILKSANDLFGNSSNKQLLLLTDGGDSNDFSEEIDYANEQNIQVFIFDIASERGSSIHTESGALEDDYGNLVIVKENPNIIKLANKTQGSYLKYSLNNQDLSNFVNGFKQHASSKNTSIVQKRQLFYYPLTLALILSFFAFFSLPKKS